LGRTLFYLGFSPNNDFFLAKVEMAPVSAWVGMDG
jgi:hypothetical protein